ncbi:hypothetical protein GDO86_008565 [Hymenochirus boettgeri]|nr:hypothetical protein GDO86_008565 [Hymenochirus boettgeri]
MEEKRRPGDDSTKWESQLRVQEEEIMLLKSALCDVLQRICILENRLPLTHPSCEKQDTSPIKVLNVADVKTSPEINRDSLLPTIPPCACHVSRNSVGTQTICHLEQTGSSGSIESIDTGEGPGIFENESLNWVPTDGIPDSEGPQESSPSPASDEGGAHARRVQILQEKKKDLLRRNSSSDKLIKDGKDRVKKLEKKSASSSNLLLGSSGSRRSNYNLEGTSVKVFLRGRPITMYIPSNMQNQDDHKPELPTEKLQLEWVYGCRGRDSRCTLRMLQSGEVIYFTACVIVICDVTHGTQRHFLRHTDCVRCLAVHPDGVRVASGQTAGVEKDGKPVVYIWDSSTLQTLHQIGLGFFERGVGCLTFSAADSGSFLCVVDDCNEHVLSIWDTARGNKIAETKTTNEPVLCVAFNPLESSYIVTVGKSHVHFWNWSGASLTKKQGIFGKYKKPRYVQCLLFDQTGDVLTGDSEGQILTWGKSAADTRTLGRGAKDTYQIVRHTRAHEGSVSTLTALHGGNVLSTGGKDRRLVLWSQSLIQIKEFELSEHFGAVRSVTEAPGGELLFGTTKNALLMGTLELGFNPVIQGHTDELWGLAAHPTQNVFLTCGHDKQLCIWNGTEHTLSWGCVLEDPGLCADFHPNGREVCVGLSTGR